MSAKNKTHPKLLDKDWLYEEYTVQQKSATVIAKQLGITTAPVCKALKHHSIPMRSAGASKSISANKNPALDSQLLDRDWLYQKYIVEKLSTRDIEALLIKGTRRSVTRALQFHGIELRNLTAARTNRSARGPEFRSTDNPLANDIEYIRHLYCNERLSVKTIAEKLNISEAAVKHRMDAASIVCREPWEVLVGCSIPEEVKAKMSATAMHQITNGIRKSYSQGRRIGCYMPNKRWICVRSSYEKKYLEYLKEKNIPFTYEATSFALSDGSFYVADFYLSDTDEFIEIKGFLSDKKKKQYELFKIEYPDVKWRIMFKEDLEALGIDLKRHLPIVYVICGPSGVGKSWVCRQLAEKAHYLEFDKMSADDIKKDMKRCAHSKRPILHDPTVKVSTFIKFYSKDFDIKPIFIEESADVLKGRLEGRGGTFTEGAISRMESLKSRADKYAHFRGTSQEVLEFLQRELDGLKYPLSNQQLEDETE